MKQISKLLSLVLRHEPEYIWLTLNPEGWANVPELPEKVISQ
jgi:RNA:NAD 2'-phosphotransferase (TPT1/KptA family)